MPLFSFLLAGFLPLRVDAAVSGGTPGVGGTVEVPAETSTDTSMDATIAGLVEKHGLTSPQTDRSRTQDGRFTKPAEEAAVEATGGKEQAKEALDTEPGQEAAPETPKADVAKAPKSWRKEAAADWARLPAAVQAEVHRREVGFHEGIKQYRDAAGFGEAMAKEFQPYEAVIRSEGGTPQAAARELLNTAYILRAGNQAQKTQAVAQICQQFGIDPRGLVPAEDGAQPTADPIVQRLRDELGQVTTYLRGQEQRTALQTKQAAQSEIQDFAADAANEHLEQVRHDMAELLEASKKPMTLKEAYDKACWANPEVRAKLLAEQQELTRKDAAKKAAEAKRAASTNIAPRGTHPAAKPKGSMEDTITALAKEHFG